MKRKMNMNKRQTGASWEEAVACCLERSGVTIRERNFRCSQGEIDIIGDHQGCLVFFEVKYRKNTSYGAPAEAVNFKKQNTICRCADFYLYKKRIPDTVPVRFDVVAVCGETIDWIQNAFDYRRAGKWR